MEIWKNIKGYEDSYAISSHGNVKSKERLIKRNDIRGFSYEYKRGGFNLKHTCSKNNYPKVSLLKNSKAKQASVHRLVAEHFIPNPENKPQVNHKDGNKNNPHVENLEWVTSSENGLHAYENSLSKAWNKGLRGVATGKYRAVYQVSQDGSYEKWECISDAVREFNFDSGGITHCCNKKNSIHKGFIWIYEDDFSEKEISLRLQMLPDKIKRTSFQGDVKYYSSVIEAAREGFNRTGITGCCKGYYKTSMGYKWEYIKHLDYLNVKKQNKHD